LFSPEDGAVDAPSLARALLADARRRGANVVAKPVARIESSGGRVSGVATSRETVVAERVVLAAGAWSPRIAGLPRPLTVVPVRGQMAATAWPAGTPPAILYGNHGYILCRGTEALLGSTMEHVGFECRVTAEGQEQIRSAAERLLPAIATLPSLRTWAGLRPVTPDGRPILGPDPEIAGLYYATGHGRNGILLAALTGGIIGDLLAQGTTEVDLEPFRPERPMSTQAAGG
jgi:glycine oxidase